jgi:hypothetical protein
VRGRVIFEGPDGEPRSVSAGSIVDLTRMVHDLLQAWAADS